VNVNQDIVERQFKTKTFDGVLDDLVTEIEALNYRVTRISHIDNIYDRRKAGINVTIGFERYKIVEFCNLNSCSELISADLRAGVFMPVRFIVYQKHEETTVHIAFLKPTTFARLFGSESLMQVATQIERDMNSVLEEIGY
jgi:uncharacterized protein (DUF302 family)